MFVPIFTRSSFFERLLGFRVSFGSAFFCMLGSPLHPLLDEKLVFFASVGVRIQLRNQVPISLDEESRDGPELNVGAQTAEDCVIGHILITDNLAVIGRVLGHPALQFHHESWIFQ